MYMYTIDIIITDRFKDPKCHIFIIHFEPPKRGQPLYKGQNGPIIWWFNLLEKNYCTIIIILFYNYNSRLLDQLLSFTDQLFQGLSLTKLKWNDPLQLDECNDTISRNNLLLY